MFKKFRYASQFSNQLMEIGGYNFKQLPPANDYSFREYVNFSRTYGLSPKRAAELFHGYSQKDKKAIAELKEILPFSLKHILLGDEGLDEEFVGKDLDGDLLENVMSLYPENHIVEAKSFTEHVNKIRPNLSNDIIAAVLFMWTTDRHNEEILILNLPALKKVQIEVQNFILGSASSNDAETFKSVVRELRSSNNWLRS